MLNLYLSFETSVGNGPTVNVMESALQKLDEANLAAAIEAYFVTSGEKINEEQRKADRENQRRYEAGEMEPWEAERWESFPRDENGSLTFLDSDDGRPLRTRILFLLYNQGPDGTAPHDNIPGAAECYNGVVVAERLRGDDHIFWLTGHFSVYPRRFVEWSNEVIQRSESDLEDEDEDESEESREADKVEEWARKYRIFDIHPDVLRAAYREAQQSKK